ncbi:MAG: hypothetical protein U0840_23300 [Gemmataceae bacterium]
MKGVLGRLASVLLAGVVGCSASTSAGVDIRTAAEATAQGEAEAAPKKPGETRSSAAKPAGASEPGEPFKLPTDEAGKLLGKVLPPRSKPGALNNPRRPAPDAPMPRALVQPDGVPGTAIELARLPVLGRKAPLRPDFTADEHLDAAQLKLTVPREPSFHTERPMRIEADPVALPPELPMMGTGLPDRIPLDDPTGEASLGAVLQASQPRRENPAPFVRMVTPEPNEFRGEATPVPAVEAMPGR